MTTRSGIFELPKHQCVGCGACAVVCRQECVTLVEDSEGFSYPAVDTERCIGCGVCEKVCPVLQPTSLGPPMKVFAAWSNDSRIKSSSSSGGVFTLLALTVIDRGGVVFGAAFDSRFEVRHLGVETREHLPRLRGSKYVQSNTGGCFRDAKKCLDEGRWVLFSGTPCQIAGLKAFLGRDYPTLLTCDLICHGVPSPGVFRAYRKHLSDKYHSEIVAMSFRDKPKSWANFRITVHFSRGDRYSCILYLDPFGVGFFGGLYNRPCCHACPYASAHREGDISLGDFWGIKTNGQFVNDDTGISLVLANTGRGLSAFDEIAANALTRFERTIEEAAVKENLQLSRPHPPHPDRDRFFATFNARGFAAASKLYLRSSWKMHLIARLPKRSLACYQKWKQALHSLRDKLPG